MKKLFSAILLSILLVTTSWATVTIDDNRVDYSCGGVITTYTYPFQIYNDSDLVVTKADSSGAETVLVLNVDYTVTDAGEVAGGTVELDEADICDTGYTLTVLREIPLLQSLDLEDGVAFSAEDIESGFDKAMLIAQDQEEKIGRALAGGESEGVNSVNTKTGTVVLNQDDILDGTTYVQTENNVTDAEKIVIGNTSGTNTGDQLVSNVPYDSVTWNGNLDTTSKNAIRDEFQVIHDEIDGLGGGHDPVTIGTANGLLLSTQEISLVAATNSTPGAATAAQITAIEDNTSLKAPLASPTFTGIPAAPTASGGTNTTQIATTAFVIATASSGIEISVATFGAVGDGTDESTEIQNAFDSAGQGDTVVFPPAISFYGIDSPVTADFTGIIKGNNNVVTLSGTGGFILTGTKLIFRDFWINTGATTVGTPTENTATIPNITAITVSQSYISVENVYIDRVNKGIVIENTATDNPGVYHQITNIRTQNIKTTALEIANTLGTFVSDFRYATVTTDFLPAINGIHIYAEGCQITNVDVLEAVTGLRINGRDVVDKTTDWNFFNDCFFDKCTYGAYIENTVSGEQVRGQAFDQCWFSTNDEYGVFITGTEIMDGITFNGCYFLNNIKGGVSLNGAATTNIDINGSVFSGNSRGSTDYANVHTDIDGSKFIRNNFFGSWGALVTPLFADVQRGGNDGECYIDGNVSDNTYVNPFGNIALADQGDATVEIGINYGGLGNTAGGGGLANIVEDTTPQLGGNLDMNGKSISTDLPMDNNDILDVNAIDVSNIAPSSGPLSIGGATGDTISFYDGANFRMYMGPTILAPNITESMSLGQVSQQWENVYGNHIFSNGVELTPGGSGTVTSITAGNGLNFTTITGAGPVTLGTPGTLTSSSSNAVTSISHTHGVTGLLTSTQKTDLTDGGDSSIHYHSADRARSNHSGTQLANTISNFDTEVSNNTTVTLNSGSRHAQSHSLSAHTSATADINLGNNDIDNVNSIDTSKVAPSSGVLSIGGATGQATHFYDGANFRMYMGPTILAPNSNDAMSLGQSGQQWLNMYAKNIYDDGVLQDTQDDLEVLRAFKGKKKQDGTPDINESSGFELIDMTAVPEHLTNIKQLRVSLKKEIKGKHKNLSNNDIDAEIEEGLKNNGKFNKRIKRNVGSMLDLTSGGLRQLDKQVQAMKDTIASLVEQIKDLKSKKLVTE